ncbi:SH3 domain containing protein [Coccidioides immitis RMSCC 3703]|uniref:SH3 domain containing protein n=1 Tax=Coccidioides immitis RMSCC 3703 TaxID=454286 RepID=A0A0J8QJ43_COCIT|nr:SH3 domain containing protein [Coccidioides immitis RMSCC 3703]
MHRQFGKLMKRSADESQVSVLLKDFDNADKLLTKIIDSSKAWRDAWSSILTYQARLLQEFETLYQPIIGSSEPTAHPPAITPESTLERTSRLKEEYESLRVDLLAEIQSVDDRMIKPAMEAKDYLQPMKKVMKKREDKKLDYERYQGRVDTARKKSRRSDRENAALAKAELDLAKAIEEYNAADDHLRNHLPGLITATFSILPHILAAQIEIQNTLLALYYTSLHNYSSEQNFPSPPPPMDVVIHTWEQDFLPIQRQAESIACISHGKLGRQRKASDEFRNGGLRNGLGARHTSNTSAIPKQCSPPRISPTPSESLDPSPYHTTPPQQAYTPPVSRNTQRQTSAPTAAIASMAAAAAKKKPPPPPPPPRSASSQIQFVTALYDFGGQGAGDLVFREGDRIRVIKKTESTDDWWEGELRGVKGSFPANYCA